MRRPPVCPPAAQSYSRDLFIFIFLVLTAVAAGYTLHAARGPVLLHRHQTEEWKGWMQVGSWAGDLGLLWEGPGERTWSWEAARVLHGG